MIDTLDHVRSLPIVRQLLDAIRTSKIHPLFEANAPAFLHAPAATTHHHNFTHGLLIHTAEVWQVASAFDAAAIDDGSVQPGYTTEELFVAVVLHDFAKIVQYEPAPGGSWKFVKMICPQETWTLRELAKHGIVLTDNELVGLLHAEGGHTRFEVDWRPLSVILHAADLWSSQVMRKVWNAADAMAIECPKCGSGMRGINGPSGYFYGCTSYPGCRGTRNASGSLSAEASFAEWLAREYPVPDGGLFA